VFASTINKKNGKNKEEEEEDKTYDPEDSESEEEEEEEEVEEIEEEGSEGEKPPTDSDDAQDVESTPDQTHPKPLTAVRKGKRTLEKKQENSQAQKPLTANSNKKTARKSEPGSSNKKSGKANKKRGNADCLDNYDDDFYTSSVTNIVKKRVRLNKNTFFPLAFLTVATISASLRNIPY